MTMNRLSSPPRFAHPSLRAAREASKIPKLPTFSTVPSKPSSNALASILRSLKTLPLALSLLLAAVQPNSALLPSPPVFLLLPR